MTTDVVVIGGGQAGLAAGYYLRRAGLDFVILDDRHRPGGSWQHYWPSLRLFSPAEYSRLPGWPMPPSPGGFPSASHVAEYLRAYEMRYDLPVRRPVRVRSVERAAGGYRICTDGDSYDAVTVVNATGTSSRPFWPTYPGMREFAGIQLHSAGYHGPNTLAGRRVAVVGGGNSAAQIVAELSTVSDTVWFTSREPHFLPDDVDGRALFDIASARVRAPGVGVASLGDIVMVPPVKEARERGALTARPMFSSLRREGACDGRTIMKLDAIVWCTGFRPALRHLQPLHLETDESGIMLNNNHVRGEPNLVFLGYGEWTGLASATLMGVGRTARSAVDEILAARRG